MGFLDQLRMENIFPTGQGGNPVLNQGTPFGMPDFSHGNINPDVVSQLLNKSLDYHNNIGNPYGEHQGMAIPAPQRPMMNPAMMPGTSTTAPQNVIWGADSFKEGNINPLEKAKLAQNADKIKQTGEKNRDTAELGRSKLDLAGETNRGKLDVSQQRADTADFKVKHPNAQVLKTAGGNYALYDPATKLVHDSGVSTGTMSQEDFLAQSAANKQEEIGSRGAEAANVQNIRNEGNLAGIASKAALAKDKQKIGSLPSQQKVDYANKAQKLINTKPELSPFVKFNSDGTFNIVAPSNGVLGGHHGPTEEQYKQISDAIYGSGSDINLPKDTVKPKTEPKNDPLGIRQNDDGDGDSDFEGDDE